MNERRDVNADAFLLVVLTLIFFGFLMVYSATSVDARGRFGDTFFIERQVVWGAAALGALVGAMLLKPRWLRRLAPVALAVSVGLLALVLVIGTEYNGARRWFRFGQVGLQVSEVAKVGLILFLAHALAGPAERVRSFRTFAVTAGAAAVVCGLILVEPDFGGAIFLGGWALLMLLVAGVRWWYVGASAVAGVPAAAWLISNSSMHLRRLTAFLDPWQDPRGAGHQLVQSLIALGSGGPAGVGLGRGQQRLSFLPEAQTDFIFATIGEQLGVVGSGVVLVLFGLLLYFGARILLAARDRYAFLLGFGALSMLVLQALANVAVATGAVPTKGTALPFVSFGGSSLVWAAMAAGLVMNAGQRAAPEESPVAPATEGPMNQPAAEGGPTA